MDAITKSLLAAFLCTASLFSAATGTATAQAQDWPPRQSTIVLGFGAGSSADRLARLIAEGLESRTGATFIVENKPGAGGNISATTVINGPADGSVILAATSAPIIVNPMMLNVKYDALKQLQPITIVGATASVLVASRKLGVKTFAELSELVKRNPSRYTYASIGAGTTSHMTMEMLAGQVGSKMIHVPFRSTPETLHAVVQGEVDTATVALSTVVPQIQAGTVVPLAITSSTRWPTLPDLPTIVEAGIPDMPLDSWIGLFVPAAVPKPIVDRMYREIKAVIDDPQVQKRMVTSAFYRPSGITTAAVADVLTAEHNVWYPLLKRLDLLLKK